jgi:hypothetical protein
MSLEAIGWVLREAPGVPSQCVSVLIGLAEHADKLGRGAYPSAATLASYARKSERQVRYDLAVLVDAKLIRPSDQSEPTRKYPPNRRPVAYDLAMERHRSGVQSASPQAGVQSASGVQPTAPRQPIAPLTGNDLQEQDGVQSTAPQSGESLGCNTAQLGVQPTADKPSYNPQAKNSSRPKRDLNEGREEVHRLCQHLADRIEGNGNLRPNITKTWLDAARLLLDTDKRTKDQVHRAIDWCQGNEFWRSRIMSMPKLREKYDALRMQAEDERDKKRSGQNGHRPPTTDQRAAQAEELKRRRRQQEAGVTGNVIQGSVIE